MVPFNYKCWKFLVTEVFYGASGVAVGILLVNEKPEILRLETHAVLRAQCAKE